MCTRSCIEDMAQGGTMRYNIYVVQNVADCARCSRCVVQDAHQIVSPLLQFVFSPAMIYRSCHWCLYDQMLRCILYSVYNTILYSVYYTTGVCKMVSVCSILSVVSGAKWITLILVCTGQYMPYCTMRTCIS